MLTEQMLRRSPGLTVLNPVAVAHHEKADGSGYHKGLRGDAIERGAGILAAVDIYVGLTTERADRPALSDQQAAADLRRLASDGVLEGGAVDAVLGAAGHDGPSAPASRPAQYPGGLSSREVEVLDLAAKGLTMRQIGERLFIAPKTVDSHIQHVYTKIGVSTRAAAALWAMQNNIVR